MPKFRKRPVIVDAVQQGHDFAIVTPAGPMAGRAGDWLITSVEGEQYPCKDSVFQQAYEAMEEGGPSYEQLEAEREEFRLMLGALLPYINPMVKAINETAAAVAGVRYPEAEMIKRYLAATAEPEEASDE